MGPSREQPLDAEEEEVGPLGEQWLTSYKGWGWEDPHLHLVGGRGAQESDVEVQVGGLLYAALVNCASWRQPDGDLEQVCVQRMRSIR